MVADKDWYKHRGAWRVAFRTRGGALRFAVARYEGDGRWVVTLFDKSLDKLRDITVTSKTGWTRKLCPEVKTWARRAAARR